MAYEIVISNSKLNSYGFRVITAGIDIKQYLRNPILLWMHNRPFRGTTDEVLPLGNVVNLRVDGDNLVGELKFDETDDFAKKIKAKWDAGVIKMVSPGLDMLEISSDPENLIPGQTRPTVTKSKLREVSLVDIGSNDDALALYNNGKLINLAASDGNEFLTEIKPQLNMKTIALKLGLLETATEQQILDAVNALQLNAQKATNLETQLSELKTAAITNLVDAAVKAKKIAAEKRDHFISLGKTSGVELLQVTLDSITTQPVRPGDLLNLSGGTPPEYKKLSEVPADKMAELRANDKPGYIKLFKAEYGYEPQI